MTLPISNKKFEYFHSFLTNTWDDFTLVAPELSSKVAKDSLFCQQLFEVWVGSPFVAQLCKTYPQFLEEIWQKNAWSKAIPVNDLLDNFKTHLTIDSALTEESLMEQLRQFRQKMMMYLIGRDLLNAPLNEIVTALSKLADACIQITLNYLYEIKSKEYGIPTDEEQRPLHLIVLTMGKLGGFELNLSSDIDLIFAYLDDGTLKGNGHEISYREFFTQIAQKLIHILNTITQDGFVFRVDMRLRPFGESGPLVMTYNAMENYYQQQGRDWERYAMVKMRIITGSEYEKSQFDQLLKPFVYRRYIDFSVMQSLREMKSKIASEVKLKDREDDIKQGFGGIREIEFICQAIQLIRGGREPQLRTQEISVVFKNLSELKLLPQNKINQLSESYQFLRRVEHRIQALHDEQTQRLPRDKEDQLRLALMMGFDDYTLFLKKLLEHRKKVQSIFKKFAEFSDKQEKNDAEKKKLQQLSDIWQKNVDQKTASLSLEKLEFKQPNRIYQLLEDFKSEKKFQRLVPKAKNRLDHVVPALLLQIATTDNQEITLIRILDVLNAIMPRSAYLALLIENPNASKQLVNLCSKSSLIAYQIHDHPILLDELLDSYRLFKPLSRDEIIEELSQKLNMVKPDDLEEQMNVLRQYKQTQIMRIATADLTNMLPLMRVSDCLTFLAEGLILHVLRLAWYYTLKANQIIAKDALSAIDNYVGILAYGKLAGLELGYSSDLDLVFLYTQETINYIKSIVPQAEPSVVLLRLVQRIMHFLSTQTVSGSLYQVDTRLRPSGPAGMLVSSLESFKKYQLNNAWTWEHQALIRSRLITGDAHFQNAFKRIRGATIRLKRNPVVLKEEILSMRSKMRMNTEKLTKGYIDLKLVKGGITDIEFIVQYLVLLHARDYPSLYIFPDNIRILEALAQEKLLSQQESETLIKIYKLFRERLHRLSLQETSLEIAEQEFVEERQFVINLWEKIF